MKSDYWYKGNSAGVREDCKPRANNSLFLGEKGVFSGPC